MGWLGYLISTFIAVFVLRTFLSLWRASGARPRGAGTGRAALRCATWPAAAVGVFLEPDLRDVPRHAPVIDKLAVERGDALKVNTAEAGAFAQHSGVMATPSLALVEQGVVKRLVVGAKSDAQIRALRKA